MNYDFSNKHFLVVGASSGIGREVALNLVECGASVSVSSRREEKLCELKEMCNGQLDYCQADVREYSKINEAIETFAIKKGKFDGVVYTAGISHIIPIRIIDIDVEKEMMDVNYWGAVNVIKSILKRRIANEGTSVVLVSSLAAKTCTRGMSSYAASKAALKALSRCAAQEYGSKSYRINTISFGRISNTDMTNRGSLILREDTQENVKKQCIIRQGEVQDAVNGIIFLLSKESGWMTGTDMLIDGGMNLRRTC